MDNTAGNTFIYALIDPTNGEIRYVGKTDTVDIRLQQHVKEKAQNLSKVGWIGSLLQCGLMPEIKVLEICDELNWIEREKHWIKHGREYGWNLLNMTNGGEGGAFRSSTPKLITKSLSPELLMKFKKLKPRAKHEIAVKAASDCASYYLEMITRYINKDYEGAYECESMRDKVAVESVMSQLNQTV